MIKRFMLLLGILGLALSSAVIAAERIELRLLVYEGSRQGALPPPNFVSTSYLQSTVQARLRIESDPKKELAEIQRVFNLQDIRFLAEAVLIIGEGGQAPDRVRYSFRLNGSAFTVHILCPELNPRRMLAAFNELAGDKPENVLTTEFGLVGGHSVIFGFENRHGKPYYCSIRLAGSSEDLVTAPPPPPPLPPIPEETRKAMAELERGAVKITNEAMPPRLLKIVEPEPPAAAPPGRPGSAYLNVRIDTSGNVVAAVVITSSDRIFEEPAVRAVKQWKYQPYLKDGHAREAVFSVALRIPAK